MTSPDFQLETSTSMFRGFGNTNAMEPRYSSRSANALVIACHFGRHCMRYDTANPVQSTRANYWSNESDCRIYAFASPGMNLRLLLL